jgi:hypothetical protein
VTIEYEGCKIVHATHEAILVLIPEVDEEEPQWVPQSQVHDDSEIWRKGDAGTLTITQWWAERQEWV